ncbi:hypothetical protein; putative signal peptide [Bradyrhizobium sp. ORS 278]|nr:hypothetical protein; putative signal peptide [Bradyrhizobium sp. ORS 278]
MTTLGAAAAAGDAIAGAAAGVSAEARGPEQPVPDMQQFAKVRAAATSAALRRIIIMPTT